MTSSDVSQSQRPISSDWTLGVGLCLHGNDFALGPEHLSKELLSALCLVDDDDGSKRGLVLGALL